MRKELRDMKSELKGHSIKVPNTIWKLAQKRTGLKIPSDYLRDCLIAGFDAKENGKKSNNNNLEVKREKPEGRSISGEDSLRDLEFSDQVNAILDSDWRGAGMRDPEGIVDFLEISRNLHGIEELSHGQKGLWLEIKRHYRAWLRAAP